MGSTERRSTAEGAIGIAIVGTVIAAAALGGGNIHIGGGNNNESSTSSNSISGHPKFISKDRAFFKKKLNGGFSQCTPSVGSELSCPSNLGPISLSPGNGTDIAYLNNGKGAKIDVVLSEHDGHKGSGKFKKISVTVVDFGAGHTALKATKS